MQQFGNSSVLSMHSAEEHNLSPFDLNIACLCQSIEINNDKNAVTTYNLMLSHQHEQTNWNEKNIQSSATITRAAITRMPV